MWVSTSFSKNGLKRDVANEAEYDKDHHITDIELGNDNK